MTMSMVSLFLLSFLCHLLVLTAQPNFTYKYCFNDTGNYTANSAYHTNLNILLSNLTSNTRIDYGFYNFSYGQNTDRVSAIGLCQGDVEPEACRSCLKNSTTLLPKLCPYQKQAMGGYDQCMLRYSDRSIFGALDADFSLYVWNENKTTEVDKYKQVVNGLLQGLKIKAGAGDSRLKFAAGSDTAPNLQTVYGLVQCTPDLSEKQCNDCLDRAILEIPHCCEDKIGGRVIKLSCNIRYERNYSFYDPSVESPQAPPALPPSPPRTNITSSEGYSNTSRTVVFIVVPNVTFILLLLILI